MSMNAGMRRRLITTLAAWAGAYTIVGLVFLTGGDWLAAIPLPMRLLVVSGILAIIMVNAMMPFIGRLVARLFAPRA
ncbi:hypothetical protein J5X84_07205 [Streptosporangiaceae bacterium NEAU-GS5]|nr:hypothetical protein [Streptosporangiaceae bacterium NEAU-GS5]